MPICVDCGASLAHHAAKRCAPCNVAHKKAYIAAYRKQWAKDNAETCRAAARAYYHRNAEARRAHSRNYKAAHRDELNAKARAYYWDDPVRHRLRCRDYQRMAKLAIKAASSPDAWAVVNAPQLRTCQRLHVTALNLPCGQREECHLNPVCEHAGGFKARNANWGWRGGDGGSLERVLRKGKAA